MSRPDVGDTIVIADKDFLVAVMHARSIMGANWQGSKAWMHIVGEGRAIRQSGKVAATSD
jgi:hypothetical protein